MYYCQTRYFVPEWGRWLNADNPGFLQFDNINGMNLFAYCVNNPIMYSDPTGEILGALIFGIILGGLISGTFSAVSAAKKGEDWVGAFAGGFITGAILGAATVLGGGLAVGAIKATVSSVIGISAFLTVGTFGAGVAAYLAETAISGGDISWDSALKNGAITFTQGLLSFGIGAAMGTAGFFDCLKAGNGFFATLKTAAGKGFGKIFKGAMSYFGTNAWSMAVRSFMKSIFTSRFNLIKF